MLIGFFPKNLKTDIIQYRNKLDWIRSVLILKINRPDGQIENSKRLDRMVFTLKINLIQYVNTLNRR